MENQFRNIKLLKEKTQTKYESLKRKWKALRQDEIPPSEFAKEMLKAFGPFLASFFLSKI